MGSPTPRRLVEHIFFFGFLVIAGYLVWLLFSPFLSALSLAAILAVICYPLYERVRHMMPWRSSTLASLVTTLFVITIVVVPLSILGFFIFQEATSVYRMFSNGSSATLVDSLGEIEVLIQQYVPSFTLDVAEYVRQGAGFITSNLAVIFTGTASTLFTLFIAIIALFYFFRDGRSFTNYLIDVSPLSKKEDTLIIQRLAGSVRGVVLGVVLVALIQGTLTAIGLSFFGFERAILWGAVAAFGALIPGVGTAIVFFPAIIYLILSGEYLNAAGVAVWSTFAVGLIDNLLGPYLMSRGAPLHPFLILLAVLGGIALFGPIGFVLGPVIVSLFKVLIELYSCHVGKT